MDNLLKLFISYTHADEEYINAFLKHLAPLRSNGLIENWYDRKILAGKDYQNSIDNELSDADIICLFISANFLSSEACIKEKKDALEFRYKKGTIVIPIILSPCGWLDEREISRLLSLPTDGKAVTTFANIDSGWKDVYDGLKKAIQNESYIRKLEGTENFSNFLKNTELLSRAHSKKEKVILDDIFIYPELSKFDDLKEYEKKISSELLINEFYKYRKVIIAGENQSGKTTLCKKIYSELRNKNYVPVYIFDQHYNYHGKIDNRINESLKNQYKNIDVKGIDPEKIIPIIDDFHFAQNKEKHIFDLSQFSKLIIIVDDIFNLNFKDENSLNSFIHFKIEELNPLLRNQLINKWIHLSDISGFSSNDGNDFYKLIDNKTELVDATLGKIFGKGIMPAYPFFLISIISTYDTFAKPLDQDITSQGYCYQAFIYMYLRKQGVKNDEIDTYINFLSEFAFLFFSKATKEISGPEFDSFMCAYLEKFNLTVTQENLLEKLKKSSIIAMDNFGNYCFCYQYLYFFFVAKYLADNLEANRNVFDTIINNLHKDENSYIAIFISHHARNENILDEIVLNATCLFDKYKPAKLTVDELNFFDEQVDNVVKAALPSSKEGPEAERNNRLSAQKKYEESNQNDKNKSKEDHYELTKELRRSVKTVEVIGSIIKNRAGSLNKDILKSMFEEAMKVHLRILTSLFELIKTEKEQKEIIEFISKRISTIVEKAAEKRISEGKKPQDFSNEKVEKIAKSIFWNLNFFAIYGLINKIVTSLGSDKLTQIVGTVCDDVNTPASFLVKHGIFMWYNKNLQVDSIATKIDEDGFSRIAKRIMKFMIVDHCSMHKIGYKDRQRIEHKFQIPSKKLLECQ